MPDPPRKPPPRTPAPLLLAAALAGCGGEAPPPAPPPPTVVVAAPLVRSVVEWDDYTARLRAVDTVEIRPRVGGYLKTLHFDDGQPVAAGDPLFTIDPRPYEAALAEAEGRLASARAGREEANARRVEALAADVQAEAALELRDTQLARTKQLVRQGAETQESYDIEASQRKQAAANVAAARAAIKSADAAIETAKANVAAAQAAVANAELNLSFTTVTAPIAGRTSRHLVDVGNLVAGGDAGQATLLTTIVSLDPIHAFVSAPERDFLKYVRQANRGDRPSSRDVQNPAVLKLADEANYEHVGAIDFVDNQLDESTDTMTGRLRFPNPDGVLTPGLFAKIQILGSGEYEALLIPDSAVTPAFNRYTVLVLTTASEGSEPPPAGPGPPPAEPGEPTVAQKAVELGPLLGGLRVVKSGLDAGDRVVVRGLQGAQPGGAVTVEEGEIAFDAAAFDRDVRIELARAARPGGDRAAGDDRTPAGSRDAALAPVVGAADEDAAGAGDAAPVAAGAGAAR